MRINSTHRAGHIPAWNHRSWNGFLLFCLTLLAIGNSQAQVCTPFLPCTGPDCPAAYPGTILPSLQPATYNGTDENFNVIVGGNFTVPNGGGAETEGRVAVGGDFVFNKSYYGIGSSGGGTFVVAPNGSNSLVVRGNIQRSAGAAGTIGNTQNGSPNIATNVLVGGTVAANVALNGTGQIFSNQSAAITEASVNFNSIFANLDTKSTCYKNLPATGTFNATTNTLVGDNVSSTQVFTLTAANLSALANQNLLFDGIPAGATVIINVAVTSLIWRVANVAASIPNDPAYDSFFGNGATDPDVDVRKVIFNFYEATSVTFINSVNGSVLVPNGDVTLTGNLNGRLAVGGDLLHNGDGSEIHNYPFDGECVCVDCIKPVVTLNTRAQILCQGVAAAPFVATVVSGTVTTSNFYGPLADTTGALGDSIGTGLSLALNLNQLPAAGDTAFYALVVSNGSLTCEDTIFFGITINPSPVLAVTDTLVCVGTVLDLTALVSGFDTLLNVGFEAGGIAIADASAFVADSTVTLTVTASNLLGCSDTTQVTVNVVDCNKPIDLSLNKSVSQKLIMLGDTITYTITITNEGENTAHGITVTDSLNAGIQFLNSTATVGSYSVATKLWKFDSLEVGNTTTLTITARIIAQGVWFNTAEITKTVEPDEDSTPGNGTDGEDDIDRECFTVPILVCRGQSQAVQLSVPAQYTGVMWFRKAPGDERPVPVLNGNTNSITATETELGSYEYTFTSTSGTCPAEGCCPVLIAVEDCCPPQVCVPFVITKKVK